MDWNKIIDSIWTQYGTLGLLLIIGGWLFDKRAIPALQTYFSNRRKDRVAKEEREYQIREKQIIALDANTTATRESAAEIRAASRESVAAIHNIAENMNDLKRSTDDRMGALLESFLELRTEVRMTRESSVLFSPKKPPRST